MQPRRILVRATLTTFCVILIPINAGAQPMPQTKKEAIKGTATVTTQEASGTVVFVEGNTLAVRMSSGELRTFQPPESRRFVIDGAELTVRDLKPGTKLKATVTTTTTPVTDRTTTVGTGKVWFVSGNTVILTLPNNENRMYKVAESYRFIIDGQKASVHDLRKGMTVSAEKIVESPRSEIAQDTVVTGHAPPAKAVVAEVPSGRVRERPAAEPARSASVVPEAAPAVASTTSAAPARLPKTASPLPLLGLCGFICSGAALGLRTLRRLNCRRTGQT